MGSDAPGIVAAISSTLAESNAGYLDIAQAILCDDIFTVTMLVELQDAEVFLELKERCPPSEKLGVQVICKREVFHVYVSSIRRR